MVGVIVLARQRSERLPLKHLYPIDGVRGSLEVLLGRLEHCCDKRVVATGNSDPLYQDIARACGWDAYASGWAQDEDVIQRLWRATLGWDKIVIVHGDSPLVSEDLVRRALELSNEADFLHCSGPSGFRVRVISGAALDHWYKWTIRQANSPLSGLIEGPGLTVDSFNLGPCEERFTIDEYADIQFIRRLVGLVGLAEPERYIEYLRDHPDLRKEVTGADPSVGGFSTAG